MTERTARASAGSEVDLVAVVAAVASGGFASASAITVSPASVAVAGAAGHGGDGGGEVGLAFGVHDQVALLPFAEGGGFYVFHVLEGQVQHAAFAGVAGREAEGCAGLA